MHHDPAELHVRSDHDRSTERMKASYPLQPLLVGDPHVAPILVGPRPLDMFHEARPFLPLGLAEHGLIVGIDLQGLAAEICLVPMDDQGGAVGDPVMDHRLDDRLGQIPVDGRPAPGQQAQPLGDRSIGEQPRLGILAAGEDPRIVVELVDPEGGRLEPVGPPELTHDRSAERVSDLDDGPQEVRRDLLSDDEGLDPVLAQQTPGRRRGLGGRVDRTGPPGIGGRGLVEHGATGEDARPGDLVPHHAVAQRHDGVLIQSGEPNGGDAVLHVHAHVGVEGGMGVQVDQAGDHRLPRGVDHADPAQVPHRVA